MKNSFWKSPQAVLLSVALALGSGGVVFAAASNLGYLHPALELKLANPDEGPSWTGFAPVVKKVLPAVVNVSSSKVSKIPTEFFGETPDDPLFHQFFGNGSSRQFNVPRQAPEQREQGVGSGVIMTPDGYILTNNHVVDGATDVRVTMADKREFKAKVIGTDPKSDIAVLKIDATNLPVITVGDSSKVQVGDYALAVGDPFGVGQTVTMGIVSATGRSHLGIEDYEELHPDRRSHQPRQFRWSAGKRPRRVDRHQYRHHCSRVGRQPLIESGYNKRAILADTQSISTAMRRVSGMRTWGIRPKKWPIPAAGSRIWAPAVSPMRHSPCQMALITSGEV